MNRRHIIRLTDPFRNVRAFHFVEVDGCWMCTSHTCRDKSDKVRVKWGGRNVILNRLIFDAADDELVTMRCGNGWCCNRRHMEGQTYTTAEPGRPRIGP